MAVRAVRAVRAGGSLSSGHGSTGFVVLLLLLYKSDKKVVRWLFINLGRQ